MHKIDLNCDLGESFGNYKLGLDDEVIKYISSANIACGFHASDPLVMQKTVALARDNGVAVGAHPGFPDLVGFGRRNMNITPSEAKSYIIYQIGALQAFCRAYGVKLQHVKPHGALYNMAAKDEKLAAANDLKARGATTYVGDGINDAPVMAAADCSASMGKLGAAAAVEASDVVLVSDDLSSLAKGRRTARKAQKIVMENISFSIFCKAAFLIASLVGILPLWLAVFADVGVMMLAVLNALRMLNARKSK